MNIQVFNREAFEHYKTDHPHIAISITDPNSKPAKFINEKNSLLDKLELQFYDIDENSFQKISNIKDCKKCNNTGYLPEYKHIYNGRCFSCNANGLELKVFTEQEAKKVLEFVIKYENLVDTILVHCEAGISRSAGIAGALSLIYNDNDKHFFSMYLPNMLVYRTILEVYQNEFAR